MTTISAWDADDWVVDAETQYENTKRVAFLAFQELPERTPQPLELALYLRTEADAADRALMERRGWRIRCSREVAGSPESYRAYIHASRGEFSCAKPSCMRFRNAWVSDRTLCYLASGRPVVVQDTGPSRVLPDGEGMFRFSTVEQAAAALEAVNADYAYHSRAARALAERHFDARAVAARILERTDT
jgi:glycosyltransferase involved in cell wall biosynthesis